MKEETLFYFSEAEFLLMLTLCGGVGCSVFIDEKRADDDALRRAFLNLCRRGLLQLSKDGREILPVGNGRLFESLRDAPYAVRLWSGRRGSALCYASGSEIWVAEPLEDPFRADCRLRKLPRPGLTPWLYQSGFLDPPDLMDGDVLEFGGLFADGLYQADAKALLRMEQFRNGGAFLQEYEILDGNGKRIVRRRNGMEEKTEIYTFDALDRMMNECFGVQASE